MSNRLKKAVEVAKATMMGDLRDVLIDIQKNPKLTAKPWSKMTEAEQREVANHIEHKVRQSVVRAIDIIASDGRRHVKVILKQITVKDGIKSSFECTKTHELRHELIDAQGDTVLVVMTNSDKYLGETKKVKIDKDQPTLPATSQQESDDEESFDPETGEIEEDFIETEEEDEDDEDQE